MYKYFFTAALLLLSSCTTELRTEEEIAKGVVLTPEQISVREFNKRAHLEAFVRAEEELEERARLRRLSFCHRAHYLECW